MHCPHTHDQAAKAAGEKIIVGKDDELCKKLVAAAEQETFTPDTVTFH